MLKRYTYDLLLPPTLTPSPTDGEVSLFTLHPPTEILSLLRAREFKPNCALVLIDFFIRHGILNTENEREYTAIVAALHRQLGMEGP